MRVLHRALAVAVIAVGSVALSAPAAAAGKCYEGFNSDETWIYVAKPVPVEVKDPGTFTVSPSECLQTVRDAVSL